MSTIEDCGLFRQAFLVLLLLSKAQRLFEYYRTNLYILSKLSKCQYHPAQICKLQWFFMQIFIFRLQKKLCVHKEQHIVVNCGKYRRQVRLFMRFFDCPFLVPFTLLSSLYADVNVYMKQFKPSILTDFVYASRLHFMCTSFATVKLNKAQSRQFLDRIQAKLSVLQMHCRLTDSHLKISDLL